MLYKLTNLRCEYLTNPLAIETQQPRLSFEGLCTREGAAQSAYRIIVANSKELLKAGKGNLWDSGRIESNQSLHIKYEGRKLKSFQQVFWKSIVWDESGHLGSWSKAASWTMGILKENEWKAHWISNYLDMSNTSPLFRKEFKATKKVRRALLHVTALGLYDIKINGRDVTDDLFAPGWTDYSKRRYYRAYDVTTLLKKDSNCIAAELGEGWYKGVMGWDKNHWQGYGNQIKLLAQLRIEFEDNSVETIATDKTWKSLFGHTVQSGFYCGETVDAQLEPKGWQKVGFDDSSWAPAGDHGASHSVPADQPAVPLESYPAEPVRRTEEIKPLKMWSISPGKVIYDFGQNFSGWVRLQFKGKAGAVIRMRFGEMVNDDKTLYVENLRNALSTDTYVMKGANHEVWEPKFTFHGFRYVEVSGCPVAPNVNNVMGIVIGSDTTPVGEFECSNPMINKLYSNAVWTQRANFIEVPTDCPQRDERLGWTGDAQVFIRTAICNMDVAGFFTKWMNDLMDAQGSDGAFPNVAPNILVNSGLKNGDAAWGDAGVVCPWVLYQCYEDKELLAKMYPHMKAWIGYLKKTSKDFLRGPQYIPPHSQFGDWLSMNAVTPFELVQTAHYAYATDITRKAAEVLGITKDVKHYGGLCNDIKKAFNKAYVKKNGIILGDTQTGYLMALKFDLLNDKQSELAVKHLVANIKKKKNHISTGFIGTAIIMSVLRDKGHLELAYRLLENKSFPSWGYSIVNGATSIWERWNGWTKEDGPGNVHMNSYSHYAYGAVVEWMFDTIGGIDHKGCGFQHITLRPQPGGSLKYSRAQFHSPYGLIKSSWVKRKSHFSYDITIPPNTRATVVLPVKNLDRVKLNGRKILAQESITIDTEGIHLGAGTYSLQF
ncbi:MAG: family 78 glycoside hydrolase catalytic domain [Lentisphaeria bacterium]|nr:glycoside hydrolase family 78 protein [Lentisphaeria bacterium]NQZ67563.1 family 78 glycoside hydrolase catalytic domain [Lentisphaeria bacterium]